jgi:SH3-like domain-containing protein
MCIIMIGANFSFSIVHAEQRGQVTNLPIPRFVSMKAPEGNVRRGPSLSHRVDWIFKQKNTPLKIIAEFGHWRQVVGCTILFYPA